MAQGGLLDSQMSPRKSPTFSTLPTETILAIFEALDSYTDVHVLAACSWRLRNIFLSSRIGVLTSVTYNSPELFAAGRWLVHGQAFTSWCDLRMNSETYKEHLQDFLHDEVYIDCPYYFVRPETNLNYEPYPFPGVSLSPTDVESLVSIWRVASAFEPVFLERMRAQKNFLLRIGLWKNSYTVPVRVGWAERSRIHMALYATWCFQSVIQRPPYDTEHVNPAHDAHLGFQHAFNPLHRIPPYVGYLWKAMVQTYGFGLVEMEQFRESLVRRRLFPMERFELAVKVARGQVRVRDEMRRDRTADAKGRGIRREFKTPLMIKRELMSSISGGLAAISSRGSSSPASPSASSSAAAPSPAAAPSSAAVSQEPGSLAEEITVSEECIRTLHFLNHWAITTWTMSSRERRISAFLTGLTRMLTPRDLLLFTSPTPNAPFPRNAIRNLAATITRRFDDWKDPATGTSLTHLPLSIWCRNFPHKHWGSFLFGQEGVEGMLTPKLLYDLIWLPGGDGRGSLFSERFFRDMDDDEDWHRVMMRDGSVQYVKCVPKQSWEV